MHQYQHHPERLMQFQHQASLEAVHQHQQMRNIAPILVPGMTTQVQGRAPQFYPAQGHADVQSSQPPMGLPLNYPQVQLCHDAT